MSKKLSWIFNVDPQEGVPYFRCPHCGRKVSGKKVLFAFEAYETCPDCDKELNFDAVTEENWLYIDIYYGEN